MELKVGKVKKTSAEGIYLMASLVVPSNPDNVAYSIHDILPSTEATYFQISHFLKINFHSKDLTLRLKHLFHEHSIIIPLKIYNPICIPPSLEDNLFALFQK